MCKLAEITVRRVSGDLVVFAQPGKGARVVAAATADEAATVDWARQGPKRCADSLAAGRGGDGGDGGNGGDGGRGANGGIASNI